MEKGSAPKDFTSMDKITVGMIGGDGIGACYHGTGGKSFEKGSGR